MSKPTLNRQNFLYYLEVQINHMEDIHEAISKFSEDECESIDLLNLDLFSEWLDGNWELEQNNKIHLDNLDLDNN